MNGDSGDLVGEILEQGGTIVKQVVQSAKTVPSDIAKATVQQAGMQQNQQSTENVQKDNESKEIVNMLYGKSDVADGKQDVQKIKDSATKQPEKTVIEEAKIAQIKNLLHKQTYYDPTFNRVKPKEEPVTERIEREEQQENVVQMEKQEKAPKPLAVDRAQNMEKYRGSDG